MEAVSAEIEDVMSALDADGLKYAARYLEWASESPAGDASGAPRAPFSLPLPVARWIREQVDEQNALLVAMA